MTQMVFRVGLFVSMLLSTLALKGEIIEVGFYSMKLAIEYDKSICVKHTFKREDANLKSYYEKLHKANFNVLLDDLKRIKEKLSLNDWFYYKLISQTGEKLFKRESENYKQAFCWFILIESGYDVMISYDEPFGVYVLTEDDVYARSKFSFNKKKYVKINGNTLSPTRVSYLRFFPYSQNKGFDFSIKLPDLENDTILTIKKELKVNGKNELFTYNISKNHIQFMKGYPQVNTEEYFKVPLSEVAFKSLMPQLKVRMQGLENASAIRYLLSYVRLSFSPKDDEEAFGYSKPMIPEEALYYEFGDCEDKSALFYYLVKELVGARMLIITYPDHVNVAVQLEKVYGKPIEYKNNSYSVCEPTEEGDTKDIGNAPIYLNPKIIYIDDKI